MTELHVVLWSRTKTGKQQFRTAFDNNLEALDYVNLMEPCEGGWFHVAIYAPIKIESQDLADAIFYGPLAAHW